MTLSHLDGKRIAVVLEGTPERRVVRGEARYEVDDDLGNCLSVRLVGEPGTPCFFFPESAGEYEFEVDSQYGCDLTIAFGIKNVAANSGVGPAGALNEADE